MATDKVQHRGPNGTEHAHMTVSPPGVSAGRQLFYRNIPFMPAIARDGSIQTLTGRRYADE